VGCVVNWKAKNGQGSGEIEQGSPQAQGRKAAEEERIEPIDEVMDGARQWSAIVEH
jgi:hypothetical protein